MKERILKGFRSAAASMFQSVVRRYKTQTHHRTPMAFNQKIHLSCSTENHIYLLSSINNKIRWSECLKQHVNTKEKNN